MPKDLSVLFAPKSISIAGASRTPGKVGSVILENILKSKYTGEIFPINPNADVIAGFNCSKSILELSGPADLLIVAVPSQFVIQTLKDAGERKFKNVVVISAGFKETGGEGVGLEKELVQIANQYEMNLIGPNCLGFINSKANLNATFAKYDAGVGNLNFISQSGAIASSLFDWCNGTKVAFDVFATLGNKSVINENDVLEYFAKSQSKGPIGMYLESISDGENFIKICKYLSNERPLFLLKPGKTSAAASAMQSHTGSIAGEDYILDAALQQAGVIRCNTLEEVFDLCKAFSWGKLPKGNKVAIVSNAGGPAVISSDSVIEHQLEMAKINPETQKKLGEILPRSAAIQNPIDLLGDALAERYAKATQIVADSPEADSLLVLLTPQIMTEIKQTAEHIKEIALKTDKPIMCAFIGGANVLEGEKILTEFQIPCFEYPEQAIYCLSKMWQFQSQKSKPAVATIEAPALTIDKDRINEIIGRNKSTHRKALDNIDANNLIESLGIKTPQTKAMLKLEEGVEFLNKFGGPVLLKVSSTGILHKKKVGGLALNLNTPAELEKAWNEMQSRIEELKKEVKVDINVQIQKQVKSGTEILLGLKRDPVFGWVMLFGAGGSLTELIADRNLHVLPLNAEQAQNLVKNSKVSKTAALPDLTETLLRFAAVADEGKDLTEIEINPVIINDEGIWAVDSKVLLKETPKTPAQGIKFRNATTIKSINLASTYYYSEYELAEPFAVKAGQFVSVRVAPDRINSYSVAGHPTDKKIALLVDSRPGGPGSKYFAALKVGDPMTFMGPFGNFTLKLEDGSKKMYFLATGSGLAPLKYMIEYALFAQKTTNEINLYLGVNTPQDVFMDDYYKQLAQEFPNFKYKIVVYKADENWKRETGFVTTYFEKDFTDAANSSVYMCGNKFMMDDVTKLALQKGCPKERIYLEKY